MKRTLNTTEVAYMLGINPRSVARWAREHGIQPVRRMRIGRSFVTVWDREAISVASAPEAEAA